MKRDRARQHKPKIMRICQWCRDKFEARTAAHAFCCDGCRQAYSNWAKGWGLRVIDAVLGWRYRGRKIDLTGICRVVGDVWDDLTRQQARAEKSRQAEKTAGTPAPGPGQGHCPGNGGGA